MSATVKTTMYVTQDAWHKLGVVQAKSTKDIRKVAKDQLLSVF